MPEPPLLFDAVLFDLDGTLVATDRFWVDAARAGAARAFEELGIERAMPSAEQWMSLVGLPLALGFERLFPDLDPDRRLLVRMRCEEEEARSLKAGGAALLPGVAETLTALRARGVRLGVASNCGRDYLDSMLGELGLARWIEEARCLDSPNVKSKSGMVADLLAAFDTRSAVMVGDRTGDRDAAWENGLPHVHTTRGFAQPEEEIQAEATIAGMDELVPRLARRGAWIAGTLDRLGLASAEPPRTIGVTGHSGSGKTLFARDAIRVLAARGVAAAAVALEDFLRDEGREVDVTRTQFVPRERAAPHVTEAYDLDDLIANVLEPHARGEAVSHARGGRRIEVPAGALLVLQGLFLLHPKLRPHLARVLYLSVGDTISLRRVAGREARTRGPERVLRVRRYELPTQRAFDEAFPPERDADLVLDAENALGPA